MIEPLKEHEGGKLTLKEKLNEVITAMNSVLVGQEVPSTNQASKESAPNAVSSLDGMFEGWRPIGGLASALYFMPPTGYKNADGVHISGMVARNELPTSILTHFNELATPAV